MPEMKAAPYLPEADLASEPLKLAAQAYDDSYALAVVNQSFAQFEAWRRNNHDNRWVVSDSLYFGNVERKVWEGTNIPRASLSQPIVFDQIEAAFPQITNSLFGAEEWFEVTPSKNGSLDEARELSAYLKYVLEQATDEFGGTAQLEIQYAVKDMLKYGNGGCMLEWDEDKGHPVVQWVDLRDIYVDPGCTTPSLDFARSIIHRRLMTLDEIEALRSDERMNIPEKSVLVGMANNRIWTAGDTTKQYSEASRGVYFSPGSTDMLPLPADAMIEVQIYWSKTKVIWVFNREWVAYNQKNPYGFIPYVFAPCYVVQGRFYAMSVPDVIGDVQLYIQALRNLRLDELHLSIMPPRVRKRGAPMTASQMRWKPNLVVEADNPKEDMIVHYPNGASANVADEIASLEISAEKRTGVNSMSMGLPRPGNANRTATGIQSQLQGGQARLQPIVQNVENYLIVPMLYKMQRITQVHSKVDGKLPTFSKGEYGETSALTAFAPSRFVMRGSSKMMTKDALMQAFPFLVQYLFAGPFMSELQKTGRTVDFDEMLQMLQDATGVKNRYNIIRSMNQQEQQALQQPDPKTIADQKKAEMDQQGKMQLAQMQLAQQDKEQEDASALRILEMLLDDMKQNADKNADVERQKAVIELQKSVQQMEVEKQKAYMQLQLEREKHGMKMQHEREAAQNSAAANRMQTEADMQTQAMQAQHDMSLQRQQGEQDMQLGGMQTMQKMEHERAMGETKLANAKAMSVLGAGKPARDTGAKKKRAAQKGK
jgi:hypothetical protein